MSERVLARIWIGGELIHSEAHNLVLAVQRGHVSVGLPGWEDVLCKPESIDGLLEARNGEGQLHLQDHRASDGHMPLLVYACHDLGLAYRCWHRETREEGCVVEFWSPEFREPLSFHGDHRNPDAILVDAEPIKHAIKLLCIGKFSLAKHTLMEAFPEVSEVPPLMLIED